MLRRYASVGWIDMGEGKKMKVNWRLHEPLGVIRPFVAALICLAIVVVIARLRLEGWPEWLLLISALVGALALATLVGALYQQWRNWRSLTGLLLLVALSGTWLGLVCLGIAESPSEVWRGTKYGAIAGLVVAVLSVGNWDRYKRTLTYDRATGNLINVTDWVFTGSFSEGPGCMFAVWAIAVGAALGAAVLGASLLWRL